MAEVTAPEAATAPAATTAPAAEVPATPAPAQASSDEPAVDPLDNGLGFKEFLASSSAPTEPDVADEKPALPAESPAVEKPAEQAPAATDLPAEAPDPKAELESRLKETRDYATREAQRAKELEREVERLKKKASGDDWLDDDEPSPAAASEVEAKVQEAKLKASLTAANAIYGEEAVKKALIDEGSPFGPGGKYAGNEELRRMVLSAEAPAVRAMELLEEIAFTERWGSNPKQVEDAIRKSEREQYEAKIEAEVERRIAERFAAKKTATIAGVGNVRGTATTGKPNGSSVVDRPLSVLGNPALSS